MRRFISSVLCVCVLFSLLAVALCGSVSAESTKFSKNYYYYNGLSKITFDGEAPYGLPLYRGSVKPVYFIDETTNNGYAAHTNSGTGGYSSIWLGKDGTVGQKPAKQSGKENLFVFEPGKTYSVKYKFCALATTQIASGDGAVRSPLLFLHSNPELSSGFTDYDLGDNATVISQTGTILNLSEYGNDALTENGDWIDAEVIFKVNDSEDETMVYYFGIRYSCNYEGTTLSVGYDDFAISEITTNYTYSEAFHTMDDAEGIDKYLNATNTTSVEYVDSDNGKALKIVSKGGITRVALSNGIKFLSDRKYYISFDGKAEFDDDSSTHDDYIASLIGVGAGDGKSNRYFFTGHSGSQDFGKDKGLTYYINGTKISSYKKFKYTNEWQHFGIVLDTCNENVKSVIDTYLATYPTRSFQFLIGSCCGGTAYIDNLRIIEIESVSAAVDLETAPKVTDAAASIRYHEAATQDSAFVSAGLRLRGTVTNDQKENADEIGFLVTPSLYAANDPDWYDFNAEGGLSKMAKKGICYSVKDKMDVVYRQSISSTQYQMILTGLSNADESKTAYNTRYVAVMYIKTGDTYQYFTVGELSFNEIRGNYIVTEQEPDVLIPEIE
ncbi:MAG: hypothetical protein IJA41_04425 [Clostridia bacterium]|nr:hypothetical protein [Clostridia bacterium]